MSRLARFYSGKIYKKWEYSHLTNSTSVRNEPVCFLWSERSGQEWGSRRHSPLSFHGSSCVEQLFSPFPFNLFSSRIIQPFSFRIKHLYVCLLLCSFPFNKIYVSTSFLLLHRQLWKHTDLDDNIVRAFPQLVITQAGCQSPEIVSLKKKKLHQGLFQKLSPLFYELEPDI